MLLLDVGNSRCKWARVEHGNWAQQGVQDTGDWSGLARALRALPLPARVIIANVGGEVAEQQLRNICAQWQAPLEFVTAQAAQCGVKSLYDKPASLGSDRWAALIAAWQRSQRACLVVNCGTATTVDALSNEGEFLGGLILPGVALMQRSLGQHTALLPDAPGRVQDFPRNTLDAMYSGIIRATQGAIAQQRDLLQSLAPQQEICCLLSGGAAGQIAANLGMTLQGVDNLVLEGLKIIGEASA